MTSTTELAARWKVVSVNNLPPLTITTALVIMLCVSHEVLSSHSRVHTWVLR
jgi:hypothetical protein